MTMLYYTGPKPAEVGGVPLPEGWPAADHDESDDELAKEKLAFKCEGGARAYSKTAPKEATSGQPAPAAEEGE